MRVSLCLMAYNEEPRIAGAIASGEGLADEVIVVDGGSTDGTVAVARAAGAQVIEVGNSDDLSANRNAGIDAAVGDWIVALDCDELIANPLGLRAFLKSDKVVGLDGLAVKIVNFNADDEAVGAFHPVRIFRRGVLRYKYRWHEKPVRVDQSRPGVYGQTEFVFEHRRPLKPDILERAVYWLEKDAEENPEDPRLVFYLARQYLYLDRLPEAQAGFERYVEMVEDGNDLASAWCLLAQVYGRQGDREAQIGALYRACEGDPHKRTPWGQLAALYYEQKRYHLAAGLLRCALALPMPDDVEDHLWFGWLPWDFLARCMYHLERYEEGLEYAVRAVELDPGNERLRENLAAFEEKVDSGGSSG